MAVLSGLPGKMRHSQGRGFRVSNQCIICNLRVFQRESPDRF